MRLSRSIVVALLVLLSCVPAFAKGRKRTHAKATTARELTEKALPRVAVDIHGDVVPEVRAAAAVVYDPETSTVLYQSNAETERSIASITKVMTASVVLESQPNLDEKVTVQPVDVRAANHTYLRARDTLSINDLLHLMLIASDNAAARVLARVSPYGPTGFVERMNAKALELGLSRTHYADPSGLLAANMSTAYDMARLITSVSTDDYIARAMQLASYSVRLGKRLVNVHTTDHLLTHADVPVLAAKTGFTNPAGFCFASLLRLPNTQTVAIVVLGARTNADRFIEAENLYKWVSLHSLLLMTRIGEQAAAVGDALHVSPRGQEFIKRTEGFHATPYHDSRGWAVGYGTHWWNGRRVTRTFPRYVTRDDADQTFSEQLETYERVVRASVDGPLTQQAFDSLVSVAYNLGRVNTRILGKLNIGAPVAPGDFLSTATVRRRPNAGLEARRLREFAIFAGDYDGSVLSAK